MRKNELREKPCRLLAAVRLRAARRVRLFANDGLQQRHVHLQTGIILLVPLDDGRDMQQCIEEIAGSGQLEDYSVFRLFCARST